MIIFTMGFTRKTAPEFFGALERSGVKRVFDVRLNNTSQLAGFTKAGDLAYFLKKISGIGYEHWLNCAPTKELKTGIQRGGLDYKTYAAEYIRLLEDRKVMENVDIKKLDRACLLCSEAKPDRCHRKLLAEHFAKRIGGVEIRHL